MVSVSPSAGAGGGVETGVTVTSRGAHRRAISLWSSSSVSKPRSPPPAAASPAKISQSGRLIPAAARSGRTRWLRPSQSLTCPSRSRNDAAGRKTLT